jgi:hypothetical protein
MINQNFSTRSHFDTVCNVIMAALYPEHPLNCPDVFVLSPLLIEQLAAIWLGMQEAQ